MSSTALSFTPDGVLPAGDYSMTLNELRDSLLTVGPGSSNPNWDREWREQLVNNLEVLVSQLWTIGIAEIYVNGSFVEDKDHPNDIDGYFVCDFDLVYTRKLHRQLNRLDPFQVWTWASAARRRYRGYPKLQLPMWHKYRVEPWPHYGQKCGIFDRYGHELEFPSAFRISRRNGLPKGIVRIVRWR